MALWQESMIALARSQRVVQFAQHQKWLDGLSSQFVGGPNSGVAVDRAAALANRGITASLFFLGEYVTDTTVIARTVDSLSEALGAAGSRSLDVCASVDPTQIGLMVDQATCEANARRLSRSGASLTAIPDSGSARRCC